MRRTWTCFFGLVLLACGGGGGAGGEDVVLPLHLLVPAADVDSRALPALLAPLPDAVEEHVVASTREVVVDRLPAEGYAHDLRLALGAGARPDVVWVPATLVVPLADAGWLVPLEDLVAADPGVLAGTESWMQELYAHEGHTYAVPVGKKGRHPLLGYAITSAAAERGHVTAAFDLVRHLRERVPLRGLCDVALDELALSVEDAGGGGDVIQETHVLDGQVRNLGDVPAENVRVVVEADGLGVIDEALIPWIESRGQAALHVDLGEPDPGLYRLFVRVDPENAHLELNEINNEDELSWEVQYSGGGSGPTQVKALSAPITVDAAAYQSSISGANPKVAFDGTNYLVVYAKQDTLSKTAFDYKLLARRVSPAGTLLGTGPTVVASVVDQYNAFDVAFGGGRYLVVWERDLWADPPPDPMTRIEAARLDTNGTLLDTTPITLEAGADPAAGSMLHERPCAFWDGSHFVVIYRDITSTLSPEPAATQYGIFARRVSTSGQVQSGKPKLQDINSTFRTYHQQEVAFAAGQGLIVFEGSGTTTKGIYGRHFTSSGGDPSSASAPLAVFLSTTDMGAWINWPCASLSSQGQYMAGWCPRISTGTGKFFRVDLSAVGGPGSLPANRGPIPTTAGDEFPAMAHDGTAYTIVTRHHVGCHSYVGAFRVNQAGTWAAAATLSGHQLVEQVDVTFGSTNGLVAYANQKPPLVTNGPNWWWGVYVRLIDKSQ